MAFEPGGYADKLGNRYEGRWIARQLLFLLHEQLRSVTVEAVGDDEAGVDLWIDRNDGNREAQQCKAENGTKSHWTFGDLSRRGSLLLLGTLVLLIREVRLRRALQRLVYRLLTMWRSLHVKDRSSAHEVERADVHHSDRNRL